MKNQNKHIEMRFSGSGGQGMMLMGDVMAYAAGCVEGKEIILTKSYGPESRGGACRSELIVDSGPINYPAVVELDFLLAMTQLACDKYCADLKPDGILLTDSVFVKKPPVRQGVYNLPLTQIAKNATGKEITANVTALGAIVVVGGFIAVDSVLSALQACLPGKIFDINKAAFFAGVESAENVIG